MIPTDQKLYNKIKNQIYLKYPKHSAYRSGLIVKEYKKQFNTIYKNNNKLPYKGKKPTQKGLVRWFKEKWLNQRLETGYKYKSDIYRPTKRITKKTPKTLFELTNKELKIARRKKLTKKRVNKF
jgi:hypothetical protein